MSDRLTRNQSPSSDTDPTCILSPLISWGGILVAGVLVMADVPHRMLFFNVVSLFLLYKLLSLPIFFGISWIRVKSAESKAEMKLTSSEKAIHHFVIVPHWKEPIDVLRRTLSHLAIAGSGTACRVSIILAGESRDSKGHETAKLLRRDFSGDFSFFWITSHELRETEIAGKSSNMAFAADFLLEQARAHYWNLQEVIVTVCDADSLLPDTYFARLAQAYDSAGRDGRYRFFTGILQFYANSSPLPIYADLKNAMSSLYLFAHHCRRDKLVPFSTYSLSLWLIERSGGWNPAITPEDYHMFFNAKLRFPDRVQVVPLYLRVGSLAADGDTHLSAIRNTYLQERRWAWGACIDGWMTSSLFRCAREGRCNWSVVYRVGHTIADHTLLPFTAIAVIIGGVLPIFLNVAIIVLLLYGVLELLIAPQGRPIAVKLVRVLLWLLLPLVILLFSVLPTLEAHLRLLFRWPLDYHLTTKALNQRQSLPKD